MTCHPQVTSARRQADKQEGIRLAEMKSRIRMCIFTNGSLVGLGHAVALLVEALCYKPEGCGFKSR
jgi:hypothetical protein